MQVAYQKELQAVGIRRVGTESRLPHSTGPKVCREQNVRVVSYESAAVFNKTPQPMRRYAGATTPPRHFDPECLSCHVTGWEPQKYFPYESGIENLKETPDLVGNGCENCHGPADSHAAAENGEINKTDAGEEEFARL